MNGIDQRPTRSTEEYRRLLDNGPAVVFVSALDGRPYYVSGNAKERFGYEAQAFVDDPWLWQKCTHPDDVPSVAAGMADAARLGRGTFEYRFRHRDGSDRWIRVEARRVDGQDGPGAELVGYAMDVTARKHAEALALERAQQDDLTGLPNEAAFSRHAEELVVGARGRLESRVVALIVRAWGVEDVRRTFGVEVADELTRLVATRLTRAARGALVARLSTTRFGVLAAGSSAPSASAIADGLRNALAAPFMVNGSVFALEAIIGFAAYPDDAPDARLLLRRADLASDSAARSDARIAAYTSADEERTANQVTLLADLRDAIERGSLTLHYQPIVAARGEAPVGVEALARWTHPRRGMVAPVEFIPLAEQTGLIKGLTEWVLGEAIHQLAEWRKRGLATTMSVNLSARNLTDEALPNTIATLLRGYGVPASALAVEVTESAIMTDQRACLKMLRAIDDLGVAIAIDDFGVGHSSLAYLTELPATTVKLDRSFVSRVSADARIAVLARAVSDLGHALGFQVLAEGVEDQPSADALRALGFDKLQGYHYARPLPAADAEQYLRAADAAGVAVAGDRSELILVVDDDAGMRHSLERMLAKRGFAVLTAADAEEALAICDATGGQIDLVLADVILPGVSGPELMAQIAERSQRARVLYMSGLSEGVAKVDGLHGLLAKPFSEAHLLSAVGEALA